MIREFLWRYRGRFLYGSVLLLATNGLALVIPLVLRSAVQSLQQGASVGAVGRHAAFIALVATVQAVTRTGSRLAILGASRRVAFDLRNRFYAHLQRLPRGFFTRNTIGDLMSRAVNDMMSVRSFFGPGALNLVNTVVIYVATLAIMFWLSPILTLGALLPAPFILVSVQKVSRNLYSRSRSVQERLADLSERAQENLSGIQMVKTYAQEEREMASFNDMADAYRRSNLALARVRGILIPLMGSLGGASSLVALWVGGRLVASGSLTLGDFVAFSGYLALLVWPTVAMGWILNSFQRGMVAMRRLEEILAEPPEEKESAVDPAIPPLTGRIEFRDLTVSYEEGAAPALSAFTLKIAAGETVALVGPVGSGKSTVAQALARFVRVPDGSLFLDGHDINRIPARVLRQALGYAPQEAFLFSRTLADNIGFGLDRPARDEVEMAAIVSGLERDLREFPDGLDTRVGEGGHSLSGGQRQRTALARALVLEPRILILDDSLSSVDSDTERAILAGLAQRHGASTTLVISHRLATVTGADRIVVLDGGRIQEAGTHAELLELGGLYADLYRRQDLERQIETQA